MSVTMKTINQQQIIFNILTWFVLLLPVTIIFSNALSDIIIVCASFFFYLYFHKRKQLGMAEREMVSNYIINLFLVNN